MTSLNEVWQNIFPQLKETLRLRMERNQTIRYENLERAVADRFRWLQWKKKDNTWTSTVDWLNLLKYFPGVEALFKDVNYRKPITVELLKSIDDGFDSAVNSFAKEVEEECVSKMGTAYLADRTTTTEGSDGAENVSDSSANDTLSSMGIVPSILLRGTSLFKYDGKLVSYAGLLPLKARANRRFRIGRPEPKKEEVQVPEGVIAIARALLHHLSIPATTSMLWLENLGKVFRCDRCFGGYGPYARVALTWSILVSLCFFTAPGRAPYSWR